MLSFPTIITGTATGLRISAVDLAAFIDNDVTIPLYADGKSIIRIYDSSLRYLEGVLKSVGGGETLDSNLINDPSFDSAVAWACQAGWSVAGGLAVAAGATFNNILQVGGIALVSGALYYNTLTINSRTAGSVGILLYYPPLYSYPAGFGTSGTLTGYLTIATEVSGGVTGQGFTGDIASISVEKVLTPSASGCTIVNAAGAQSFISKDASFTYNAASYTYRIWANKRVIPRKFMGVTTVHGG
jgi:hypothetical protein